MEEMPPRRMGSIRVVVVFSSRLNFFSGGPEPPSPAVRLLPGPDMAAAARSSAGIPRDVRGRRWHFCHLKTDRRDVDATGAPQPQPSPAHTC